MMVSGGKDMVKSEGLFCDAVFTEVNIVCLCSHPQRTCGIGFNNVMGSIHRQIGEGMCIDLSGKNGERLCKRALLANYCGSTLHPLALTTVSDGSVSYLPAGSGNAYEQSISIRFLSQKWYTSRSAEHRGGFTLRLTRRRLARGIQWGIDSE